MKYIGSSGTVYNTVESVERKGGEGSVFDVEGNPGIVLKVYHDTNKPADKIIELMKQAKDWDHEFKKWTVAPMDCVFDENRVFVGYIMKKFNGDFKSLAEVYDMDEGKTVSYDNKVRTAMNLCSLTYLAHKNGVVIGDYNQKNIAVGSRGEVSLFDNDSFQITSGNKVYRCIVGVHEEMAPEIFGKLRKEKADLASVSTPVYNIYTDYYTLALHVFHLLMNGAHPFNTKIDASKLPESQTVSSVTLPLKTAAEKGIFAVAHPTLFYAKPSWVPKYDILSEGLRDCFERAFVDGLKDPAKRPTPSELFSALREYLDGLKKLPCGHWHYSDYGGNCEWCRISKKQA